MKKRVMFLLNFLLLSAVVVADEIEISDVESEFSNYKEVKATKELKQSIHIGFSNLTGNTETLNLNGKYTMSVIKSGYNNKPLKIMFDANAFVTENNDVKDNEEFFSFNQYLEYTNQLNKISDMCVKLGAFENFENF